MPAGTYTSEPISGPSTTTPDPATTPATPTPDQDKQNTKEQKNLVNLTPEKIAKVSKLTEDRITQLKTQFETEVNNIIKRLSKNADYSSDKLNQYSVVMKNQFNSYIYDQWYGFYQKAGDQKKLTELAKVKKENEAKFKQSLDLLNTKISEKQQQIEIKPEGKYKYFSNQDKKDIDVTVIGKALGKDQAGEDDKDKPEHNTMWQVKK